MLRTAIKNLLGHKLRMFLTGFSIILGVSFVSGTYIFTDSIGSTFDNLFKDVYSGTDLTVRPKVGDFSQSGALSFPSSILDEVKKVDGVSVAVGSVAGYAQYLDKDGMPVGGQGPPTLGFSWGTEQGLNPLKINEGNGRAPEKAGEVVIDKATADKNGFKVGDKVKILLLGPAEEFTVVGIANFGEADGLAGATIAAFEVNEARRVFGISDNSFSVVSLKAETSVTAEELKSRVDKILPETVESITGEEQSNEQLDQVNQGLGFINTALLAFAGIAVFVGSFIIQNTFRIIVSQSSRELALLRAIGASKRQVTRLVLYEATFVAIIASAIGIISGLFIAKLVRVAMNAAGVGLPDGPLTLQPRTIVISMSVGILVTLFAALIPALKASKVSPIEALRENAAESSKRGSLFKRAIGGLLLGFFGVATLVYGLNADIDQPLAAVGFGVVCIFIGISILAPFISIPIAKLIGIPLIKFRGVPARLARDNAIRSPKRTASSAAALMIGVSLISMVSILASSFKAQITSTLDKSFPADIFVQSLNIGNGGPGTAGFSVTAYDELKKRPELTDVTAIRTLYQSAKVDGTYIDFLGAVDFETIGKVTSFNPTENAFDTSKVGGVVIADKVLEQDGKKIGDSIELEFSKTGKQNLEIVGSFTEPSDFDYLISTQTYFANFDSTDVMTIFARTADGYSDAQSIEAAKETLKDYKQLQAQDKGELYKSTEEQIDQALGLFWALLGFAVIIAMLGITNTLMLSVSERTKEIGMLRAIGMTRSQVKRMIRFESITISLFGALLGVSLGLFFAWAIIQALESEGITTYSIPFGQVVMYFILAIIAGILAAAWPARKAARMDVLKAIYHD